MKTDFITDCMEISQADLLSANPVVSILMITYNHERFLAEAIEGVVKQVVDFPIELIIGEDCSTDNTRQVALDYQKKYPNLIRVLYSERNIGPNKNVARVLSRCRGQFVAICEGDDYWVDRYKLQKQVEFLQENQSYVVCYHNAIVIDDIGNKVKESKLPDAFKHDFTNNELMKGSFLLTLSMCFRNVVCTLPEEFFYVLNADTFLISLLGNYGAGHYMSELKPAVYRQHAGGIWSSLDLNRQNQAHIVTFYWISTYYKRMGEKNISSFYGERCIDKLINSIGFRDIFLIKLAVKYEFNLFYKVIVFFKNFYNKIFYKSIIPN